MRDGGARAALLDIDFAVITALVADQFKGKEKLVLPNIHALELGHKYAKEHFDCPIGIRVKKSDKVGNKILIDGNTNERVVLNLRYHLCFGLALRVC